MSKLICLTKRERDVFTRLALGLRPDQIADQLNIGTRTVDKYIVSAKSKLGATTRDQAVAICVDQGLINLSSNTAHSC